MSQSPSKAERVRALVSEGAELLAARRLEEAIIRLAEAYRLAPDNVAAAINLGGAYILQGKHAAAAPVLEAASHLEPNNVMIWTNLAAAYLGKLPFATTERQDKAIEAFERALSLDPATPHVHYNLALIYLERRDLPQATQHFYAAMETDPADRDAANYLDKIQRGEYKA